MDLVNFDLEVLIILKTLLRKISELYFDNVEFVPISAKKLILRKKQMRFLGIRANQLLIIYLILRLKKK